MNVSLLVFFKCRPDAFTSRTWPAGAAPASVRGKHYPQEKAEKGLKESILPFDFVF
jgi:hypothetical protein